MGITDSAARLAAEADLKGRTTHATHRTTEAVAGVQTAVGQAARAVRDHTPAPVRRATAVAAVAGRTHPGSSCWPRRPWRRHFSSCGADATRSDGARRQAAPHAVRPNEDLARSHARASGRSMEGGKSCRSAWAWPAGVSRTGAYG